MDLEDTDVRCRTIPYSHSHPDTERDRSMEQIPTPGCPSYVCGTGAEVTARQPTWRALANQRACWSPCQHWPSDSGPVPHPSHQEGEGGPDGRDPAPMVCHTGTYRLDCHCGQYRVSPSNCPVNKNRCLNVGLMLGQHRRWWPIINPTLGQWLLFTG